MKKKNGFTLIELLAIIVILAIIAVITVPIILDIIDNAKKGAATDSFYGYKDSISKYYVTKLSEDPNYTLNGIYTVDELEELGVQINGEKPEDGWVKIKKGNAVDYSLQFSEYVVSLDSTTNKITTTKNGELKTKPFTMNEMCPNCVFGKAYANIGSALPNGYGNDYTSLGDYFLGQIVENNLISRSFACGKEGDEFFCIEGNDTSKYTKNVDILNQFFPSCGASTSNSRSSCHGSTISADARNSVASSVGVYSGSGICYVNYEASSC